MDEEERQRRMQELQMADLGTARREYISTVDLPNKYRHVGLDQIEAIRAANIKGSKVQKIAQANRAQLNAWNNAHQTIGGDVQLEDLDDMMSGQSHRAQLFDSIRAKGGQAYIHDPIVPPKGPSGNGQSSRASKLPGRGAGAMGSRGGHRCQYLDPAFHPEVDDNIPGKHAKLKGVVGATPKATKSDKVSRGRGCLGAVKTRRVVDPGANFEAMLAGPSDFMAVAKVHNAPGSSGPPGPRQSTPAQTIAVSNQTKKKNIANEKANIKEGTSHKRIVVEGGNKGETEKQINDDTSAIIMDELDLKGGMILEQNTKLTAESPWAIQVDSLPSDSTRTGPTDLSERKTEKGFRSSLPQPIHASEESTYLIDLIWKTRSPSNLSSPLRSRQVDSGSLLALRSPSLSTAAASMETLLPGLTDGSAGAIKASNSSDGASNGAVKGALDLLIERLQKELDQVNQIIDDSDEPVESTGIGTYLLSRKKQLEREIAEAIEMESDIALPLSALTLEDQQSIGEHNISQEILTPRAPNTFADKSDKVPSVCDIIGNHLLPGRNVSSTKSGLDTPKVVSEKSSLHGFVTTTHTPIIGEAASPSPGAAAVTHSPSINELHARDTPSVPDNATTRQYMQPTPELPQSSTNQGNVPPHAQRDKSLSAVTQQFSNFLKHSPEQSRLSSYPLYGATATVQYSSASFHRQEQIPASQSPGASTPSHQITPGGVSITQTLEAKFPVSAATLQYSCAVSDADIRGKDPPPPAGQENRNPYTVSSTRENSETSSMPSSNNPPRLLGLENSKWAMPTVGSTSPKGARKQPASVKPENGPRGNNMFAAELAKHGITVSKRSMGEATTNSGPLKCQKKLSDLASSKWAS
ncbi:predicted protein [Histoplasma capsulatum var. duboisii H88]|uniref:Predicted protein n=1 Tax=Ajellomyces capsulatus (strain H88) TaxID=544711 RepID=F0U599_AJEC8|nr:predicted protein [Histoplasma capsulatum var. duboisii H88]